MQYTGYGKYIAKYIEEADPDLPIYTANMTNEVAGEFHIDTTQARKVVNVNMKRIADRKDIVGLKRYSKGIYFKPKKTALGDSVINPIQIVIDTYIKKDGEEFGYETGPSFLNRIGLSTQIPKYRYYATNKCKRYGDNLKEKLKVVLRKPVTVVTKYNRSYLQFLDVVQNRDKVPIDVIDKEDKLIAYIENNKLDYIKLIAFAKKYYGKEVTLQVAELAVRMVL